MTELLGKPRFQSEVKRRTSEPGVATGLAWTPVGGDVLFVEAVAYPGDGKLQITGQLGDVMKESAAAALSYVRNARRRARCRREWFQRARHPRARAGRRDPEGRPERRASRWPRRSRRAPRCRPVRSDTAMTGEITLTGMVLPIGGLKEKALAAQRAGINRLIIPRRNEARHRRHPRAAAQEDEVHARGHGRRGARRGTPEARRGVRRPPDPGKVPA